MEVGETYSRQVELAAAPVGQRAVLVPATNHLLHLQGWAVKEIDSVFMCLL